MPKVSIFNVVPLIGADLETTVKAGLCHFVCDESHPDPEAYCRDKIYPHGFQVESLDREFVCTNERLLQIDEKMHDDFLKFGYAIEYVMSKE